MNAIVGTGGAYAPCKDQAASLPVDPAGAIVGSSGAFVAKQVEAGVQPAPPEGAIVGDHGGFVPKPCSCLEPIALATGYRIGYSDAFDRTVAFGDPPGHEVCEDWIGMGSIEIDPDEGLILPDGASVAMPEISGLPIDFVVGVEPPTTGTGDEFIVRDFFSGDFEIATRYAMASGPHTGETRIEARRINYSDPFGEATVFLPRQTAPYFMRVFADQSLVRARIWDQGTPEPGTWTIEYGEPQTITNVSVGVWLRAFTSGGRVVKVCGISAAFAAGNSALWEQVWQPSRSWKQHNTYLTSFGGTASTNTYNPTPGSSVMHPGTHYLSWSWSDWFQPASSAEMTVDGQAILTAEVPLRVPPPDGTLRGQPTQLVIAGYVFIGQEPNRGPAPSGEGTFDVEIFEIVDDGASAPGFPVLSGDLLWTGTIPDYIETSTNVVAGDFVGGPYDLSILPPLPDDRLVPFEITVELPTKDYMQLGCRITDDFADLIAAHGPWGGPLFAGSPERSYFIGFAGVTTTAYWNAPTGCGA